MVLHPANFQHPAEAPARSELSIAFETFWRGLPKEDGLVPRRGDFRPERAARFLRHIVLCEVQLDGAVSLRMRLIGTAFEQRIQRDLRGHDYLEFLPAELHQGALDASREIVRRPCGLWQVMPVHYERGFAHHLEITAFPLKPGAGGLDLLLILTQAIPAYLLPTPTGDKVLRTDTALTHRFIDIGAGLPG
jgi:hypothetical protein